MKGEPSPLPAAIFLMGPTASGKTDVAMQLLASLPCEIISVDSAMIYRGMDIGTAKPSAEELSSAPHRLIDILDPAERYSAADFRNDALREMAKITAAGRIPLLVGGTMLYYRTLQYGLSTLPSADSEVRRHLEAQAAERGWQWMHDRLANVDPTAAARIHPNDPQRIQRALEVYEISGESMTVLMARQKQCEFPYRITKLGLVPSDRQWLRDRVACRFDQMLGQGFVDEVAMLRENPALNLSLPSMRCVGYRQIWEHLDARYDYDAMRDKGVNATCQLAKRQLTWLRSEQDLHVYDPLEEGMFERLLNFLKAVTI